MTVLSRPVALTAKAVSKPVAKSSGKAASKALGNLNSSLDAAKQALNKGASVNTKAIERDYRKLLKALGV